MARPSSIRRTVANLLLIFSPAAANFITLSNFQPLSSESSIPILCRAAYSAPLFRCTNADFTSGQTCSKYCVEDLENVEYAVKLACQDVEVDPGTLLGQAQESNLVDRLCSGTGTGTATGAGVATTTSTSVVVSTRTIGSFSSIPTPSTMQTTTSSTRSVVESETTIGSSEPARTSTVVVETTRSSEETQTSTPTPAQTQSETDTLAATSTETTETTTSTTDDVPTTAQTTTTTFTPVQTTGASRTSTRTQLPNPEPTTGGGSPFDTVGTGSSGSRHVVQGWFGVLLLVQFIFLLLR